MHATIKYNKVFCIGLSRTGTTSLHELLQELDLRSVHYIEPLIEGKDWTLVDHNDAISDTPIPLLFKSCDQRYPHSKFILTTRNKDAWLDSMKWLFRHGKVIWNWPRSVDQYHRELYGTKNYDQKKLSRAFDEYHDKARSYFKDRPEDLLEINIDNGFEVKAICDFLNVPLKKVTPIHIRDRRSASFQEFIKYKLRWLLTR
ncbi:sulfotransferase family protein [Marinoscillum sp. MHG1-6]|uniref:sulfotransferase family protein n=1 Tax=Marinoscillum sp. MHG1-6 TaxID=2959627 RepID=UPI00215850E2|nr:sulfotransferase family protein [Marinoscillum sp. MHG1-6]